MSQLDLTFGIRHLNGFGRLVCLVSLIIHAGVCYVSPSFLLVILGCYATAFYGIYHSCYKNNFCCATRYERESVDCPSNSRVPNFEAGIDERIRELLPERRETLKNMDPLAPTDLGLLSPAALEHKRRSAPRLTLNIDDDDCPVRLSDRVGTLDMDHVQMTWVQFMTGYLMIGPSALFLQVQGMLHMALRKWLHRHGLVEPMPVDYHVEVSRMCLESMQAIHFVGFKDVEETVAIFAWNEFPYVVDSQPDEIIHADLLTVDIDLTANPKRMIKAMMDDRELTASEAYILIAVNIPSFQHPKVHALANWGLHTGHATDFVRWNSVVTVMYNYFGMTTYTQMADVWKSVGILNYDYATVKTFFEMGIEEGIIPHEHIRKLVPHSALVKFLVGTRNIFLNEFQDYRSEFAGIDGEALFAGTILHSLEHKVWSVDIKDVLWLDHTHTEFGFMAEIGQMVLEGFVKDLPLLPFNRRYKNAPHPFYKAVYEGARNLNPWLADRIDTCIIK